MNRLYIYILAIILVPALVTYGIILRTNPKKEEVFTVFVEANITDSSSFKDYIKDNTNPNNKEINIYSHLSNMNTYEIIFQTQGIESDILILSEQGFKDDQSSYFIELSSDNKFYSSTNKIVEDKHFGIEIYDGKSGYLTDYINFIENNKYFIFLNKDSIHTSQLLKDGKTNQIITLLEAIYG